jgi:hypothetical protein
MKGMDDKMGNKIILRTHKTKTTSQMSKMYKHNFRLDFCKNVDKDKSSLNEVLYGSNEETTYAAEVKSRIKESDYYKTHKVRKDAVLGIDVLIGFGKLETVEPQFNLNMWKAQCVEWLQEEFGKENVASVVLHLDERQPHIHAFIVPMVDGKLNCKEFLGTRENMRSLQDSIAEKMENLGLERGAKRSIATHRDIKEFYGLVEQTISDRMPDCNPGETAEQFKLRAEAHERSKLAKYIQENLDLKAINA